MSQYKLNRKGAVALGYNTQKDFAPKVLAKGVDSVARQIIDIAIENKILVREDPLLFDSLYKLEAGEEIPAKLYQVVAELLAYVYKINKKKKKSIV